MAISEHDFEFIRMLVRQRSAIIIERGKEYLAETRLAPLAEQEGFASVTDLVASLRLQDDALVAKAVEAIAINETSFFRDTYPFEALAKQVIPKLIERRAADRTLNIWCAAASTGQEPYSVAVLLREFDRQLDGWSIRIVATDLSEAVLAKAAAGRYTQQEVNRGMPARMLVRYFKKDGLHWQVCDEVRQLVEFRQLNLMQPWPSLPAMDIIILRNVLIYFDLQMKQDVARRVRKLLKPDGYLLVGSAETMTLIDQDFTAVWYDNAIMYQVRQR